LPTKAPLNLAVYVVWTLIVAEKEKAPLASVPTEPAGDPFR